MWVALVSLALTVALLTLGLAFGLGSLPDAALSALARQLIVAMLTGLIAFPAAWVATLGRGLLPGIGVIIAITIASQVAAIGGVGAWFPFSAPGLWAVSGGMAVSVGQLALVLPVAGLFGGLTVLTWRRLQLDR